MIIESTALVFDKAQTIDNPREETDVDDQRIISTLRHLVAVGISPSRTVDDVAAILNKDSSVLDVCNLNPRAAYQLRKEVYETIDHVADASLMNWSK